MRDFEPKIDLIKYAKRGILPLRTSLALLLAAACAPTASGSSAENHFNSQPQQTLGEKSQTAEKPKQPDPNFSRIPSPNNYYLVDKPNSWDMDSDTKKDIYWAKNDRRFEIGRIKIAREKINPKATSEDYKDQVLRETKEFARLVGQASSVKDYPYSQGLDGKKAWVIEGVVYFNVTGLPYKSYSFVLADNGYGYEINLLTNQNLTQVQTQEYQTYYNRMASSFQTTGLK